MITFLSIILILIIFGTEREYRVHVKSVNDYDKMMAKNNKANNLKRSIVSTLEMIAYKEWAIDSLNLVEKKYDSMDSILIRSLQVIEFEFGYSDMLNKINHEKTIQLSSDKIEGYDNLTIDEKKMLILFEIDVSVRAARSTMNCQATRPDLAPRSTDHASASRRMSTLLVSISKKDT